MTDQGKANYEGYHASIPGASPVPFEELPHLERLHWDAGAVSVEMSLADQNEHDESPLPDDAPELAKVIVVTEVADSTRTALGIAKTALEAITRISDPNAAIQLAADALGAIFAETEL